MSGIALIGGAGEGLGAALGRRFAKGGCEVVLSSRSQGERADLREESEVVGLFDRVEKRGPIEVAIFNPGANFRAPIAETPAEMFEKVWRLSCYAGFLFGREAARRMLARGRGTILFTGATASLRGGKATAAFAPAKAAQRSLAQSMARTLWPRGIHVALMIVDGVVNLPRTREAMPDRPDTFFVDPASVAEMAWFLAHQDRQAWSFEVETRPFGETW